MYVSGYLGLCPAFIQLEGELREHRDVSGSKGLKFALGGKSSFLFGDQAVEIFILVLPVSAREIYSITDNEPLAAITLTSICVEVFSFKDVTSYLLLHSLKLFF